MSLTFPLHATITLVFGVELLYPKEEKSATVDPNLG